MQNDFNANVTNQWVLRKYAVTGDLLKFKGQQVMLFSQGTNDKGYQPTDFSIDDVVVSMH
jgi:hypothetical protein